MPDPYAAIAEADPALVARLADVLEIRAVDPQQRAMLVSYLADVPFTPGARILEVGCGTGAIARELARLPVTGEVVGLDPSPVFVDRARELSASLSNLAFREGDGRDLPFEGATFDVVVCHTSLCHMPECERALTEAHRVLRPGGHLAVFDGDYATTTVAIGDDDPLQTCAATAVAHLVHDPWLARRLPALVAAAGFATKAFRSHGYLQTAEPTYMLTLVDRGADIQAAAGRIGPDLAEALKAEARRRIAAGRFHGHITYVSLVASRHG
jgi:ubiquinone/menaquinone biosynthesis C-methylase UbiE